MAGHRSAALFAAGILLCLALVHVVATRLSWSGTPLQTDTGMWAYIGGRILDGALPYRDLWESKPPGIYYTFAAVEWLFGRGGDVAFLWLDAILTAGVLATTYAAARRLASAPAAAGGVLLLSLVFCHRILADWGNNVEKFVALFETLALLLLLRASPDPASRRKRRWLEIGFCCGAAGLFKQTGCLLFSVLVAAQLMATIRNRADAKPRFIRMGLLVLGAAGPWVPVTAYMLWQGNFTDFWQQAVLYDLVRTGSAEVERSRIGTAEHWTQAWDAVTLVLILFGPAFVDVLASASGRVWQGRPATNGSADSLLPLIRVYWIVTALAFLVAPYGYGHYLLQAAPAAAILTASFVERVWQRRMNMGWPAAAVLVASLGVPSIRDHLQFTLDSSHEYRTAYKARAAFAQARVEVLRQYTTAGQSVMLWPPDYAVSYYAERRTPLEMSNADVIFKGKIGRLRPSMPALLQALQASPPDVILDWTPLDVEPPAPDDLTEEPQLLVPRGGFSLAQDADEGHPMPEGRALAPAQRWVRETYGGQQRVDRCMLYYHGRPWRSWRDVLLPRAKDAPQ